MERRLLRSGRTAGSKMCSYRAGVGIGAKAGDSAADFATTEYYHHRKHEKALKMGMRSTSSDGSATEDSFSSELHDSLCKEVDGTPMKNAGEVLRVEEKRYSSPSVIARLMGLDDLPPVVSALDNVDEPCLFKKSFGGSGGRFESYGNQLFHVSRRERYKIKNVHELFKSSKAEKHSDQVFQEKTHSRPDLAFIRQQFVEAIRLSTDESLQNSKKFNEVLDILQANKDIFLELLEHPDPLFAKHLHDFKLSNVSAHTSNVASLRTLSCKLHGKNELFDGSLGETWGCMQKLKDKYNVNDHMDTVLHKLLRPRNAKEADSSLHSTSIVVLKPNVQKPQSCTGTEPFSRPLVIHQPSFRRRKEFGQESSFDQGKRCKLFHPKTVGCKAEGIREIPKDVAVHIKQSSRCHSEEVQSSKVDGNASLFACLREPSLSKKARKHLSERWKMTRRSTEESVGEVPITLAEMLSLSDTEPSGNSPEEKAVKEGIPDSCGISSRDNWKEKFDSASPSIYGTPKPASRRHVGFIKPNDDCCMLKDVLNLEQNHLLESKFKRKHSLVRNFKHCDNSQQSFRSCGEENKRPAREVEMYQGEQKNRVNQGDLIEQEPLCSRLLKRNMDNIVDTVYSSSNPKGLRTNFLAMSNLEEFQHMTKHENLMGNSLKNGVEEVLVASVDSPLREYPLDSTGQYVVPIGPIDAERLSPVSVLEPPEDGKPAPVFFDLRGQIDLLELEPFDCCDDEQPRLLTLGDNGDGNILDKFKNGMERDFSYLLDVLTVSGIHAADEDKLYDACCSPSNPVFPDVFDKLEKKYNAMEFWSRSERKLLFDHINSILSEVLAPCVDLHPWVRPKRTTACDRRRLAYESWRILVEQQKELPRGKPEDKVLDTRWLFLEDDVDMVGREIERTLKDDLLDELVSELVGSG